MKTTLITILAALAVIAGAQQLQIVTVTNTIATIPATTWSGASAQLLASQLAAITNADGTMACPALASAQPGGSAFVIYLKVVADTNGLPVVDSITVVPK
jgi:hypothetical protein